MHGPAMTGWLVVTLCAAAGAYCLLRLRGCSGARRGTARGEALMGFGMAAMAVPATAIAPPRWVWLVYAVVFGAAALHTLGPARRTSHHLHHLVGMLAMVYMSAAMAVSSPGGTHGAHSAGGSPLATGVLLIYYAGYVLWMGARLLPLQTVAAPETEGSGARSGGRIDGSTGARTDSGLGAGRGAGVAAGGAQAGGTGGTAISCLGEAAPAGGTVRAWGERPELAMACRLSMGIAMLAMLLTL